MDAFNYDLEKLPMQWITGVTAIIDAKVVPGWRVNTTWGAIYFNEGSNSPGVIPYSGGQCVQLIHDNASFWNPSDPNIKGLYKDFIGHSRLWPIVFGLLRLNLDTADLN